MNRLKELRANQKKTQQDMSEFLNMSRRGYQKIENGESQIKPDKA
ncbi:TPA: helix-turn-helix domain-containing protein, partial [Streptococcus agalactiae]